MCCTSAGLETNEALGAHPRKAHGRTNRKLSDSDPVREKHARGACKGEEAEKVQDRGLS